MIYFFKLDSSFISFLNSVITSEEEYSLDPIACIAVFESIRSIALFMVCILAVIGLLVLL